MDDLARELFAPVMNKIREDATADARKLAPPMRHVPERQHPLDEGVSPVTWFLLGGSVMFFSFIFLSLLFWS
jgi:hypothetical protein